MLTLPLKLLLTFKKLQSMGKVTRSKLVEFKKIDDFQENSLTFA